MKALALIAIFALHTTGLWPHLSNRARTTLTRAGGSAIAAAPVKSTLAPIAAKALPVRTGQEQLKLDAASAYAIDVSTNTVLFEKNAAAQRPIASVTKVITSLVILSRHDINETVTIPKLPDYGPEDEIIGLTAGETFPISDLLKAALIQSANDAADALAIIDAGSKPAFAARMNATMNEWGITGTHFSNPTGLQDQDNYASAQALAKISQLALTNPIIRDYIPRASASITDTNGRTFYLKSTNKLLATGEFYGIKTGYTLAAGECFVGLTRIDGHEVITVVLGSGDRFGVTQALSNWIERNYTWL